MSRFASHVLAGVLVVAGARTAAASTYSLNCTFSGPEASGTCANPTGPFGTVTILDNGTNANWVNLTVDLTLPASPVAVLKNLFLNTNLPQDLKIFDPATSTIVEYEWLLDPTISKIEFNLNDRGPTNAPNGGGPIISYRYLDLNIEAPTGSSDPWTGILKLQRKDKTGFFNLDPSTFDFQTNDPNANPNALVWTAVQYQLNTQPSFTQVAVGSLSGDVTQLNGVVPEPATLVLLGSGLAFAARRRRSRR